MPGPALQLTIKRLEPCEHSAHAKNRVLTLRRTASVRRLSFHEDLDPLEAFVTDRDREIRGLRHDSGVDRPSPRAGRAVDTGRLTDPDVPLEEFLGD